MKRIRIVGLTLVAACAIGAMGAGGATAALPEFYHCVSKTGGKFASGCTASGSGFEKEPVASSSKIKFTSKSGEGHFYVPSSLGVKLTCEKDKSEGEITGPKTVKNLIITFEGCKALNEESSQKCEVHSPGPLKNEVVTAKVEDTLGYIKSTEKKVGALLKAESGPFTKLEGTCLPVEEEDKVTGSVIGEATPINTLSTAGTLKFKVNAEHKQVPTKLEGETGEDELELFETIETGLASEDTLTFSEAIETKA